MSYHILKSFYIIAFLKFMVNDFLKFNLFKIVTLLYYKSLKYTYICSLLLMKIIISTT